MRRPLLCVLSVLATSLSLLAVPAASPSSSAQRAAASLSIGPEVFVGGQSLTFTGSLPEAPNTNLKIETLFNRSGDAWNTRDGIVGSTDARGDFTFQHPGPNNYGIRYRVRAVTGATTPAVFLEPRQQEVALSVGGGAPLEPAVAVVGTPLTIDVDTTPVGRGNLGRPAPAFPGRPLLLQQRVRVDQWEDRATTVAGTDGSASFLLDLTEPGAHAFRVVMDDIRTDGNQIGWFPSHPLPVTVVATEVEADAVRAALAAPVTTTAPRGGAGGGGHATPTAGQRYRWGPALFDFAWEGGESLTDRPDRGTRRTGGWIDASDGSGRVAHYNGGMALTSHVSEFPGNGDRGTTTATLAGNAMTYGRWEFRRRIDVFEDGAPDYRVTIDLVPASDPDATCGSSVIHVADVTYDATRARVGVSSRRANRSWTGTRRIPRLGDGPHSFGVEVTRRHITWFLDGESIATVRNRKAAPGVPLTPRLGLVGNGQDEMRRTRVLYDWQRGWPLNKRAAKADKGPRLQARPFANRC